MRKKLALALLLLLVTTSAFADGVIGSGTRADGPMIGGGVGDTADPGGMIGSGTRSDSGSILGSGGLRQRILVIFAQLQHAITRGASR